MKQFAYYSGEIETKNRECFVGEQKIDCPKENQSLFQRPFMQSEVYEPGSAHFYLLPPNPSLDVRNDFVFISIFLVVILSLTALVVLKIKFFNKTLGEYIKPIWYFVLIAIAAVLWQYLVGVTLEGNSLQIRISQWIWEAMVLVSAYKLSKISSFSCGNMFFLGVLYSVIIHGLKVAIRYFFYAKTLWYAFDRFLYGSLLVMLIAGILGSVLVYLRKRKLN